MFSFFEAAKTVQKYSKLLNHATEIINSINIDIIVTDTLIDCKINVLKYEFSLHFSF